ncbi:EpsG family protein, partial [Helicobacter typhlonius]
ESKSSYISSAQNFHHSPHCNVYTQSYLSWLYLFPLIITPFSPFYAYIVCVFIMVGLSATINTHYRILLSLTLVFNIAVIYSSRLYFNIATDFDDDFSRYYQNYLDIYDNISGAMFVWGGGFEIGLPLFYKLLSLFLPKLIPQYLLFFTALGATSLFYIWCEYYGTKWVKPHQKAALIAFACFIGIFLESLGLTRQCFASIFLLFGFFAHTKRFKILFFACAIGFHLSSILIIVLFYTLYYFPKLSLCIALTFFVVFVGDSIFTNSLLRELAPFLDIFLPSKLASYFTYYVSAHGYDPLTLKYIPIIKVILMCCVIFCLFIITPHDKLTYKYKTLILVSFGIYMTNIVPHRIVSLVCIMCFYFIVFVILRRFYKLALLFFFPYFLKLCFNYLTSSDNPQTQALELFHSFDIAHFYPFYYFLQGGF